MMRLTDQETVATEKTDCYTYRSQEESARYATVMRVGHKGSTRCGQEVE